jgi:hypothetical protein
VCNLVNGKRSKIKGLVRLQCCQISFAVYLVRTFLRHCEPSFNVQLNSTPFVMLNPRSNLLALCLQCRAFLRVLKSSFRFISEGRLLRRYFTANTTFNFANCWSSLLAMTSAEKWAFRQSGEGKTNKRIFCHG